MGGNLLFMAIHLDKIHFNVEIIRFNSENVSIMKRITDLRYPPRYFSIYEPVYSLDFELNKLYIYSQRTSCMHGFDFQGGRQILEITLGEPFTTKVAQLSKSTFVLIREKDRLLKAIETFQITVQNEFTSLRRVEISHQQTYFRQFIRNFDKCYVFCCRPTGDLEPRYINFLFDFNNGKEIVLIKDNGVYTNICLNWNMDEISLSQASGWIVKFLKHSLPAENGVDCNTLKHKCRISCLKWFDMDYLRKHLPKSHFRFLTTF